MTPVRTRAALEPSLRDSNRLVKRTPRPDHHLTLTKHGNWVMDCCIGPTPITRRKVQLGLGTKSRSIARARRDLLLAWLDARGVLLLLHPLGEGSKAGSLEDRRWLEYACGHRFSDVRALRGSQCA